jgi:hypothetical protein
MTTSETWWFWYESGGLNGIEPLYFITHNKTSDVFFGRRWTIHIKGPVSGKAKLV